MPIDMPFISKHFQNWEGRRLKAYIPCYVNPKAQTRIGKTTRNYTGDNGLPDDYNVIGASSITGAVLIGRLEERIMGIEARARQHEDRLEYLRTRTEEQERQLARFEGTVVSIPEIKADLKELLRK